MYVCMYVCTGANRWFNSLAGVMIKSLHYAISHHPPICHIDVYIFTDRDNFPAISNFVDMYGVKLWEVPYEADALRSATLKISHVFSIPEIHTYDAVLFVDIAVLFNVRDIGEIMSAVKSDRHMLHILQEQSPPSSSSSSLSASSYYNTGMYVFHPNTIIKNNFEIVGNLSSSTSGSSNPSYITYRKQSIHTKDLFPAGQVVVTQEVFVLIPDDTGSGSSAINNNINNNNNENENSTDSTTTRGLLRFERLSGMVSFSKKHLPWIATHSHTHSSTSNRAGQYWTHRDSIESGDCAVLFNLLGRQATQT